MYNNILYWNKNKLVYNDDNIIRIINTEIILKN